MLPLPRAAAVACGGADVVIHSQVLRFVLVAATVRMRQLGAVVLLFFIIIYIYSIVSFNFFSGQYAEYFFGPDTDQARVSLSLSQTPSAIHISICLLVPHCLFRALYLAFYISALPKKWHLHPF